MQKQVMTCSLVSAFYKQMVKTPANELADELGENAKLLGRMLLALHDALSLVVADVAF